MIGLDRLRRRFAPAPADAGAAVAAQIAPEAAARSHVGKVREINEDRFLVRSEHGLWAVADGMGGHAGGGDAADAAIAALARAADLPGGLSGEAIERALGEANTRICTRARAQGAKSGTTIVVAWLSAGRLSIYWAGDSRAYLCREGVWQCLTRDHSVVQELVDLGEITPEQAERHPHSNQVTRALGAADSLVVDKLVVGCGVGDRLLLCSDGVSRTLDLGAGPGCSASIGEFVDSLLGAALARDGSDNATLVAIDAAPRVPGAATRAA